MQTTVVARDRAHLEKLIGDAMATAGNACSLNHMDAFVAPSEQSVGPLF